MTLCACMYAAGWISSTEFKRMMNGTTNNDGHVLKWIHIAKF